MNHTCANCGRNSSVMVKNEAGVWVCPDGYGCHIDYMYDEDVEAEVEENGGLYGN